MDIIMEEKVFKKKKVVLAQKLIYMDIIMEGKKSLKKSGPCSETDLQGHNNELIFFFFLSGPVQRFIYTEKEVKKVVLSKGSLYMDIMEKKV